MEQAGRLTKGAPLSKVKVWGRHMCLGGVDVTGEGAFQKSSSVPASDMSQVARKSKILALHCADGRNQFKSPVWG